MFLELRHFRDGAVRPTLRWQVVAGGADMPEFFGDVSIGSAESVEDVVVKLKGVKIGHAEAYRERESQELVQALTGLGLPLGLPGPDDGQPSAPQAPWTLEAWTELWERARHQRTDPLQLAAAVVAGLVKEHGAANVNRATIGVDPKMGWVLQYANRRQRRASRA